MKDNSNEIQVIIELMKKFKKTRDEETFNYIYTKLEPLLKKYARKLYSMEYDDAMQELSFALYKAIIEIKKFDNEYASFGYIESCLYHCFCNLNRFMQKNKEECYAEILEIEEDKNYYSLENAIYFFDLFNSNLTVKEKKILLMSFYGYSDKEIGIALGTSRQYINRIKKKIFESLK